MFSTPVYTVPILADATLPFLVPVIELALTVIDGAVGAVLSISIVIGVTSPIKFPDKSWQDPVIIPTVCVVDPVFETTTLYNYLNTSFKKEITDGFLAQEVTNNINETIPKKVKKIRCK